MGKLQERQLSGGTECAGRGMSPSQTLGRPLVLIIEDDQWIQAIASELLEDEGFATASATNGEIGLRMAQELRPAVILLDLGLPAMTGAQFLRHMHRHEVLRETPVIVVTGKAEIPSDVAMQLAAGVLKKPFDLSELLDRVHRSTTRYAPQLLSGVA